jgi:hypothetical protein
MRLSRTLLDWNVWYSLFAVYFLAPRWLINLRSTKLPTEGDSEAELFAYPDILQAGTSLFLYDGGGYIYLGKIHHIIKPRPQPNEKLDAVSVERVKQPGKNTLKITHHTNNYDLEIDRDTLLGYV